MGGRGGSSQAEPEISSCLAIILKWCPPIALIQMKEMGISLIVSNSLQRRQPAQRGGTATTGFHLTATNAAHHSRWAGETETAAHILKAGGGYTSSSSYFNLLLYIILI